MPFLFPPFSKGFHLGFQMNGCAPRSVARMPSRLHEEHFPRARTLWFRAGLRVVQPGLFGCLLPGRSSGYDPRQAKRDPKRRGGKKKKKMGQNLPSPCIRLEVLSSGKGKQSTASQSSQLMLGGISGPDFIRGELLVASLPMAAADF